MAKITFKQSELDQLFGEKVVVVDGNIRRVTKSDILQKSSLPGNFEVEIEEEDEKESTNEEPLY